ncbi:MAG: PorV/PorQ family protein [Balneolaceae bacterium]|nr:PorV/PorQ family protein [Balneolaceae bacterium]MBO6546620.1 PorV/PorQ family protein [Balneolaceae bacterium]MBO6648978.1 PorV/PorQ family protein [Balneolaceae bacterium]
MKKIILSLLVIGIVFSTERAEAQLSKVGTTAAEFLRIPVGARSSAMSAYAATVNDPSAMILNPAGLADLEQNELLVEVTDWYLDITHTYMGVAVPTKKGVAGVHVLALNYGEFEETTAEAQGLTGRTFDAYSITFGISYAQYLIPQFTIGGTAKVVYETIAKSSASTVAFDIGTMYDTPFYGVRFGVSVTNFGSKLQMQGNDLIISSDPDRSNEGNYEPDANLATDAFDLPLMLKVGLAWDAVESENVRATLSVDGNNPTNNVQSISIGGEVGLLNEQIQIRAGVPYIGQEDSIEKFNAGLGVKYQISDALKIGFNYTYHGYKYLGDVNKLSIQIYF